MKFLKLITALSGCFFLYSCFIDQTPFEFSSSGSARDRDSRTNRKSRGSSRSGYQCEDSNRCKNICDRILDYSKERLECYNLSLKDIGDLESVVERLVEPSESDLDKISSRNFDFFMEIGYRTWNNIIIGRYRIDEAYDDDDEDEDDYEDFEYSRDEARAVLDWLVTQSNVSQSLRDFSGSLAEDILYNILLRAEGEGHNYINNTSLISLDSNDDKDVLKALGDSFSASDTYLGRVVRQGGGDGDSVSALYEVTHNMLSDICERNRLSSRSKKDSYKICLSAAYFCGQNIDWRNIRYYLLRDSYRTQPENYVHECNSGDLSHSDNSWRDYWN